VRLLIIPSCQHLFSDVIKNYGSFIVHFFTFNSTHPIINMSKFLGLRTLIYKVPDLDGAKAWYTKIFGVAPYFDEPFHVGFEIGGYEFGLQPLEGSSPALGARVSTYWGVDNVQAVYDQLLAAGATPFEEPMEVGDGIIVAAVQDPWGNVFGVIYNPHFKAK
jgi:predicted enzyme related to lactoylglutathione lyase